MAVLIAVLLAVGVLNLVLGAVTLGVGPALRALVSTHDQFTRLVVWELRFPRFLDAVLVGAALGVSGALLQVVTRNPLADPTILGISAAAGLALAIGLVVVPDIDRNMLAVITILGGLAGAAVLLSMAWQGAVSSIRLTLAGIAVSAMFGAAIVGLLSSSQRFLELSLGFLAGGMYGSDWRDVQITAPVIVPALAIAIALSPRLNALALGDELAAGLGVLTDRTRLFALFLVGALTGAAVSIAGLVSFVGLVSPHISRTFVGDDYRYLVPASALTGAVLVTSADLIARLVIRPAELPMGILTAAVGAPFLLYLVRFRR
ncbi:MAG: iron ABC transporter permease [Dehalococcoidia bacterium]|nr:iron ABC transporter permease [Dehalococcoidia bacterium]MCB9482962.1 iron ABC transporter permease [Dehalococcoidia bacterium]